MIGTIVLYFASIRKTGGLLIYSLDDPYIHLSLADRILQGGYGVNANESSSPSSSILYPYLLAGGVSIGLGDHAPIVLSIFANLVLFTLLGKYFSHSVLVRSGYHPALLFLIAVIVVFTVNGIGLQFTGMEHSFHVLASVMVVIGLIRLSTEGRVTILLALGVILSPLMRFEGLALALPAIVAIAISRNYLKAAAIAFVLSACLLIYALHMHALGLPFFPSSVTSKSSSVSAASDGSVFKLAAVLFQNGYSSLFQRWGVFIYLGVVACAAALLSARDMKAVRRLSIVLFPVGAALTAHLVAGAYGWFSRYEVYAIGILLIAAFFLFSASLESRPHRVSAWLIVSILTLVAAPYVNTTFKSPSASKNIFEQQYQMQRFAKEYFSHPVAVNDLGLVSLRHRHYVLDLLGLGSETVRKLRAANALTAAEITRLAQQNKIVFSMVYDETFPGQIPESWRRMAVLHTSTVIAPYGDVVFYLVDASKEAEMQDALDRFRGTLPSGARMSLMSERKI